MFFSDTKVNNENVDIIFSAHDAFLE